MSKVTDIRLGVQVNIEVAKGRTFKRTYHVQYYDSGNTLQDFSWNDYSGATMQVRRKPNSPISELEFSTDDDSIVLNAEGRFTLNLDYTTMDSLRAGSYDYDMYLIGTTYPKRDFIYGEFIVFNKITR